MEEKKKVILNVLPSSMDLCVDKFEDGNLIYRQNDPHNEFNF